MISPACPNESKCLLLRLEVFLFTLCDTATRVADWYPYPILILYQHSSKANRACICKDFFDALLSKLNVSASAILCLIKGSFLLGSKVERNIFPGYFSQRFFEGCKVGNNSAAVISQALDVSHFTDGLRLSCFLQGSNSFSSVGPNPFSDRRMRIKPVCSHSSGICQH